MDPLNKQERTEAFIKVLALFLLTAVLMAIPMYYAFKLPGFEASELEKLQNEIEKLKSYDKEFLAKTESARDLYGQFEMVTKDLERDKTRNQYSTISNDMEDFSKKNFGDTAKSKLYGNVVFSFDQLFNNQEKIFILQDSIDRILHPIPVKQDDKTEIKTEPTLNDKFKAIVIDALRKYDNNRRLAGQAVGLKKEKTFSAVVEELGL